MAIYEMGRNRRCRSVWTAWVENTMAGVESLDDAAAVWIACVLGRDADVPNTCTV